MLFSKFLQGRRLGKAALPLLIAGSGLLQATTNAEAQSLPAPSRTIFKCEEAGKITYSDSPCVGAQKIDVEPTRGVSKLSGSERTGRDVQIERHREIIADALRPLTGMDAKQLEVRQRRMRLAPDAQRECLQLDERVPAVEGRERLATGQKLAEVQRELYHLRTRFRELRC